jgi:hypothetical protein
MDNSDHGTQCMPLGFSAGSDRLFQDLDLYRHSPESRGVWCTSRHLKRTICSSSEDLKLSVPDCGEGPEAVANHLFLLSGSCEKTDEIRLFSTGNLQHKNQPCGPSVEVDRSVLEAGACRLSAPCGGSNGPLGYLRFSLTDPRKRCVCERQISLFSAKTKLLEVL